MEMKVYVWSFDDGSVNISNFTMSLRDVIDVGLVNVACDFRFVRERRMVLHPLISRVVGTGPAGYS